MPFDDEEEAPIQKIGLKQVSSKKSLFEVENQDKPSQEEFNKRVEQIHQKTNDYKSRASELALNYKKLIFDKTLPQNKNIFLEDLEKDTLSKMISLAVEINNDENEQEGMGTLSWITLLLKYFLYHRDRINSLEHSVSILQKSNDDLIKKIQILTSKVDSDKKSE